MRLKNKIAIVTGVGSRGIGRAIASAFVREGARVVISGRTLSKLEDSARELRAGGGEVEIVAGDISQPEEAVKLIRQTVERFGRVDILVNNAAIIVRKSFIEITPEEWDQIFAINVRGCFLCSQSAAREMIKQGKGKIIMISSTSAWWERPLFRLIPAPRGPLSACEGNGH
jgi:3-oxoacyl-[acyl-carrier protein] reductase